LLSTSFIISYFLEKLALTSYSDDERGSSTGISVDFFTEADFDASFLPSPSNFIMDIKSLARLSLNPFLTPIQMKTYLASSKRLCATRNLGLSGMKDK